MTNNRRMVRHGMCLSMVVAVYMLVAVALIEAWSKKTFLSGSCPQEDFSGSVFGACWQCCDYGRRGAWEVDEKAKNGTCFCKLRTYAIKACWGMENCEACCLNDGWVGYDYSFEMDIDLSYKEGNDCVCKLNLSVGQGASEVDEEAKGTEINFSVGQGASEVDEEAKDTEINFSVGRITKNAYRSLTNCFRRPSTTKSPA